MHDTTNSCNNKRKHFFNTYGILQRRATRSAGSPWLQRNPRARANGPQLIRPDKIKIWCTICHKNHQYFMLENTQKPELNLLCSKKRFKNWQQADHEDPWTTICTKSRNFRERMMRCKNKDLADSKGSEHVMRQNN